MVTPCGVEWAIKIFDPFKPPHSYPALLREGLHSLIGPLTKALRTSISLRYVSQTWYETKVIFVPKIGKNGHILAKDFRPINLTSFILQTLETG